MAWRIEPGDEPGKFSVWTSEGSLVANLTREEVEEMCEEEALMEVTRMLAERFGEIEAGNKGE